MERGGLNFPLLLPGWLWRGDCITQPSLSRNTLCLLSKGMVLGDGRDVAALLYLIRQDNVSEVVVSLCPGCAKPCCHIPQTLPGIPDAAGNPP